MCGFGDVFQSKTKPKMLVRLETSRRCSFGRRQGQVRLPAPEGERKSYPDECGL